jgi:NADPH:quinone reductase-like Zn-dependent oxidoreductase
LASKGKEEHVKAVRFDHYGGPEVLEVREVERPLPAPGEVLVGVKAAAINPGEIAIREGLLESRWPTTFPCGEGSDFAGVLVELGAGVGGFTAGDAVIGWTSSRASHAEFVAVPADQITAKPDQIPWEVAGSLFVAPLAAYASVKAVAPQPGEVVVVSAAAGGVGGVATQLAARTGATVIGLASEPNHDWLRSRGAVPVTYGDGQAERIRAAAGGRLDAFIDTFGGGYVDLAVELGIPVERINTIIDYAAVERLGVRGEGTHTVDRIEVVREIVDLVAEGSIEIPIAATFPLSDVREAFRELAHRKTHGKIVLLP